MRNLWNRLMLWSLSKRAIFRIGFAARALDWTIHTAMIALGIWVFIQIASAFLPGQPAWLVIHMRQ
jgi:predicted membrane protein